MAPLADIIHPYGVDIVTYADDTQLVVTLNHSELAPTRLLSCLEEVVKWMDHSHLKLNCEKTELMILGNPSLFRSGMMCHLQWDRLPSLSQR